ncbi:MAG: Crp/Fnr family transcriptional regulator [Elusimicrobia bacterium]|nr:Crp/Fnr family transcriptional regulator [Elusimicrobiota bacterium]
MDLARFFLETAPFSALPPEEAIRLAALAHPRTVARGERIYAEGDEAARTYLVVRGQVQITRASSEGKPWTIEMLGPGDMFGCVGCAAKGTYPCGATAGEEVTVAGFPLSTMAVYLEKYPAFSQALYWDMSRRLREAQKWRTLGAETVDRRIAGVLLWLESKFGPTLPFTRQAIAEMASTTPESAIRALILFRRRGYIKTGWKKITLHKSSALRELIGGVLN